MPRLTDIAVAGAPPSLTDYVVGLSGGVTDRLYTLAQIATAVFAGASTVSGGGTVNFLRADGVWAPTPGAALFTNVAAGVVPPSGGGVINFLRADGAWISPVAGSAGQLEFNSAGTLGGASGTTWDNTNLALTIAGATLTASNPILNLSQTWNAAGVTFTGFKFNVTNTASAAASKLFDFQVGGISLLSLQNNPSGQANLVCGNTAILLRGFDDIFLGSANGGATFFWDQTNLYGQISSPGVLNLGTAGGSASGNIRIYNLTDSIVSPTNYERGVFDWVTLANALTIGTQKGGTGQTRNLQFVVGNTLVLDYGITNGGGWTFGASSNIRVGGFGPNIGYDGTNAFVSSANASGLRLGSLAGTGGDQVVNMFMYSSAVLEWNTDLGLSRVAANVLGIGTGAQGNTAGFFNWGGEARVTSDFSVTSSTALTNVTGLSVNVAAGRTYKFETELYVTDAAAGGVQAAIAGTATATAIQYTGYTIADNAIKGKTNATALATAVGSTLTTETAGIIVRITGTITVNAAGTLTVQMAQNTSSATPTVAKRGSWLTVYDMP